MKQFQSSLKGGAYYKDKGVEHNVANLFYKYFLEILK